jgi:hypothetical protein
VVKTVPDQNIKLDFCPQCRKLIDRALDTIPSERILIKAPQVITPDGYVGISLCKQCGNFIKSVLGVEAFKIFCPKGGSDNE